MKTLARESLHQGMARNREIRWNVLMVVMMVVSVHGTRRCRTNSSRSDPFQEPSVIQGTFFGFGHVLLQARSYFEIRSLLLWDPLRVPRSREQS